MEVILASASPRRCDLLKQIGASFSIEVSGLREDLSVDLPAEELVSQLAINKALDVAGRHQQGLVIGADTVVVLDQQILGKPIDDDDAKRMLRQLSGRSHEVMTAVAIVDASGQQMPWQGVQKTQVWFRKLSDQDINDYLSTKEHRDKAGSYGIQGYGALLVDKIEGCYFNIVGLPLQLVAKGLQQRGVDLYGYGKREIHD